MTEEKFTIAAEIRKEISETEVNLRQLNWAISPNVKERNAFIELNLDVGDRNNVLIKIRPEEYKFIMRYLHQKTVEKLDNLNSEFENL